MPRVLIADDHDMLREMIVAYVEREEDIELETADSFHTASQKIEDDGPYDLVLLDYDMPGMNGLMGLKSAMELNKGSPVGILSGTAKHSVAKEALDIGAAGFLPKTMAAKSLINALRFMIAGEKFAPFDFMQKLEDEVHPLAEKLTERELAVLDGLCRGLANKEIAREIDLQEVTVKLHVKTLCRKLEARNRTHAAMIAKEHGLF